MNSVCCNARTIKGGVLAGEEVEICTKCKKPVKWGEAERVKRNIVAYKLEARYLVAKIKDLKKENKELIMYVSKLERFNKRKIL